MFYRIRHVTVCTMPPSRWKALLWVIIPYSNKPITRSYSRHKRNLVELHEKFSSSGYSVKPFSVTICTRIQSHLSLSQRIFSKQGAVRQSLHWTAYRKLLVAYVDHLSNIFCTNPDKVITRSFKISRAYFVKTFRMTTNFALDNQ
jgi:hypothetical protein